MTQIIKKRTRIYPKNWVQINLNTVRKKNHKISMNGFIHDMINEMFIGASVDSIFFGVAIFHIMLNEKDNTVSKKRNHFFLALTWNDKAKFMNVWTINFIRMLTMLTILNHVPQKEKNFFDKKFIIYFFSFLFTYSFLTIGSILKCVDV